MLKKSILFTTVIVFIALASFVSLSVYTLYSKKQLSVDPKLKEISGIEFDKKKAFVGD